MDGELSTFKKAVMPVSATLGGMIGPAVIYTLINLNSAGGHGWSIHMATDIAFALTILSMAGKNIPTAVKVFLSELAVADDLGTIVATAFFYTAQVNLWHLELPEFSCLFSLLETVRESGTVHFI